MKSVSPDDNNDFAKTVENPLAWYDAFNRAYRAIFVDKLKMAGGSEVSRVFSFSKISWKKYAWPKGSIMFRDHMSTLTSSVAQALEGDGIRLI